MKSICCFKIEIHNYSFDTKKENMKRKRSTKILARKFEPDLAPDIYTATRKEAANLIKKIKLKLCLPNCLSI